MADTNNTIQQFNIKATADVQSAIRNLESLKASMQSVDKGMSMAGATQSLRQFESELSTMARDVKSRTQDLAKSMSPNELRQALKQSTRTMNSAQAQMTAYADSQGQMWRNAKVDITKAGIQAEVYRKQLEKTTHSANEMKIFGASDDKPFAKLKFANKEWLGNLKENGYYQPDVDTIKNTFQGVELNNWQPSVPIEKFAPDFSETNAEIESTSSRLDGLKSKLSNVFSISNIKAFASDFVSALKTVSNQIDELIGKLGEVGGRVASAGRRFLSAINPMKLFRNEQNKTALASSFLGKMFSRVARMFRIMVTRMLIRAFISNIRSGFQNIAKYSDEVNQKFSQIGASAKTMFNSFASAFTPIIEAITPFVTKILDAITSAMNKVGEFFSALTGKSYYIKATKFNYDYAKSLDNSTKATKKNTKATDKNKKKKKELKDAQIGIDRLNVISPDKNNANKNNNNGNNGNGNNGANVNDMFDTKPVSKKMKKLAKEVKKIAKKLFAPIKKAWDKEGKGVIKAWKKALKSVWETVKAIGRDFLKVWGQKKTIAIFRSLFRIMRNIGKIVKNLSDNFRKAWNTNKTGKKILENIRDIVKIIVEGFERMSEATVEWSEDIDFSPLLTSLKNLTDACKKFAKGGMTVLVDFYEDFLLPISKWTIEKGFPQFVDIISGFVNDIDWESITTALDDFWVALEPFVEGVGQGLIDFFKDMSKISVKAINKIFGEGGAMSGITTTLENTDPEQAEKLGYALGKIAFALIGFKAIKKVAGILIKIGGGIKVMAKGLGYLMETNPIAGEMGIIGIADALNKVVGNLPDDISNALNQVEGIFDFFVVLIKNMINDLFKTILNLIKTPYKAIIEFIKTIGQANGVDMSAFTKEFDVSYDKIRSWDELVKDSSKTADKYKIARANKGYRQVEAEDLTSTENIGNFDWKVLTNSGKKNPLIKEVTKFYNLTSKELKKFKKQNKKYKISISDFFDSSAEKKLKRKAKKWGIEIPKSVLEGLKEGRMVAPKNAEELKRQVKFDKLLQKSKIAGKDVSKSIYDGVTQNKIDIKDAVKYEKLIKKAKEKGKDIPTEIGSGIKGNKESVKNAIGKLQEIVNGVKGKTVDINANTKNAENKVKNWKPKGKTIDVKGKVKLAKYGKKINITVNGIMKKIQVPARVFLPYYAKNVKKNADKKWGASGLYADRAKWLNVKGMAKGGYPKLGSTFIAGESGAEFVGNINGKTGVASNMEITGIREEVATQGQTQNALLQRQNQLLVQLLEKETDVNIDGVKLTKKVNKINNGLGFKMALT